jgi:hypothetical protein
MWFRPHFAGYSLLKFKDRFEEILFGILSREGLTPNNLFLRDARMSVEGVLDSYSCGKRYRLRKDWRIKV